MCFPGNIIYFYSDVLPWKYIISLCGSASQEIQYISIVMCFPGNRFVCGCASLEIFFYVDALPWKYNVIQCGFSASQLLLPLAHRGKRARKKAKKKKSCISCFGTASPAWSLVKSRGFELPESRPSSSFQSIRQPVPGVDSSAFCA